MAHGIGQTKRAAILNNLFNAGPLTAESAWYISLHTGDPGADGQTANEVSGNNYSRVNYGDNWNNATGATPSVVDNANDIVFPTASGSWGTITYAGIWNHASNTAAANFIARVALTPSQAIDNGNVATIPATTLIVSLGVT